MTGTSLGIILIAAFLHAFWNTLAKKSYNKIVFIWWAILFSALFGIIWLGESHRQQRLMGAILIALGVAFIGMSR